MTPFRTLLRAAGLTAVALLVATCGGGGGGGGDDGGGNGGGGETFGLDERPANATCLAPDRSGGAATYALTDAYPTAPAFTQPTKILQAPGDGSRWFVLEKTGRVKTFATANPAAVSTWLDLSARVYTASEGGLLGMAFDPDWPGTREAYVSWTGDPGGPMVSRITRVIPDDATAPSSVTEQEVLTLNQPFSNHNGGDIAFDANGDLFLGFGDGGGSGDTQGNGQNQTRLLGKVLRLDVRGVSWPSPGYLIPPGNPNAGNPVCGPGSNALPCPEIYASGFRNPWRWSFDIVSGQLWLADVGQNEWEEIDVVTAGGNYGWRCREGAHPYTSSGCSGISFTDPVFEYPHADGDISITGGFVYRGTAIPSLQGRYVFADFASGRIWALQQNGASYVRELLVDTPYQISAFGVDADNELYIADYGNGRLRRLVAQGSGSSDPVPDDLTDTGCVSASDPAALAPGVVPYAVNAPFWSDGADKSRGLALPDGGTITLQSDGDFQFPPGTVLVKRFDLGGQPIETRLLMRHPDGEWAGYTYEWNDAGTAATRVRGGKTRVVGGQTWIYPGEGDCLGCHTEVAGFSLGLSIAQLNGDFRYPATGRTANQLATLEHIGMFSTALPAEPSALPALPDPADVLEPVDARARAWLDTNCAQCHRPGGPTGVDLDLRNATALAATGTCDVPPQAGDLGLTDARIIAPGDPARSVLVSRIGRRDAAGMPPLGSAIPDDEGVALVSDWIGGLSACN